MARASTTPFSDDMKFLSENELQVVRDYVDSLPRHSHSTAKSLMVAVAGSEAVGKKCLIQKLRGELYSEVYDPTLQYDSSAKFDIFGQRVVIEWERAHIVTKDDPMYELYRYKVLDCDACILCYSPWRQRSFLELTRFLNELDPDFVVHKRVIGVVATKYDIPHDGSEVPQLEGTELSRCFGVEFREVSAKSGFGLRDEDIRGLVMQVLLCKARREAEDGD